MKVDQDPDAGRRVLQCACDRTCAWTGREDAIKAGWGARWEGDKRVWECPSCFVPAPPVEFGPPNLATPERILTFAFGTTREREAREQLHADGWRGPKLEAEVARLVEIAQLRAAERRVSARGARAARRAAHRSGW